jgi:hypothetical protein
MGYRLRSILYLHGYAVTKIKTTFAAQPPPLRVVSSEQVAHTACTRRVGFCGIFKHFSGFGLFLLPSRIHARPHAGNANR